MSEIEIIPMSFVITGRTPAGVETAKAATRLHIAFYASTRTYHAVRRFQGWEEAGQQLHGLSLQGNWPEMGKLITDEMLDEFAVMGTYDEVGPKLKERAGGTSLRLCSYRCPRVRSRKRSRRSSTLFTSRQG